MTDCGQNATEVPIGVGVPERTNRPRPGVWEAIARDAVMEYAADLTVFPAPGADLP